MRSCIRGMEQILDEASRKTVLRKQHQKQKGWSSRP